MTLYKYLHPDRTDVIEKLQIRFSPAISMNDAFELKPLTKGWASKETAKKILVEKFNEFFEKADTPEKMLQIAIANHPEGESNFRNTMKAVGATEWFRMMKEFVEARFESESANVHSVVEQNWNTFSQNISKILGTQIGILSLSEDPHNPVMWGHYADSNRGFAIGFDERHPWFDQKRSPEDEFCHLRRVTYISDPSPRYFSELTAQDVGYSKMQAWSYEKEWRILFPLQKGINTGHLDTFGQPVIVFPFPADSIREIILGSRATDELVGRVELLALQKFPGRLPVSKRA